MSIFYFGNQQGREKNSFQRHLRMAREEGKKKYCMCWLHWILKMIKFGKNKHKQRGNDIPKWIYRQQQQQQYFSGAYILHSTLYMYISLYHFICSTLPSTTDMVHLRGFSQFFKMIEPQTLGHTCIRHALSAIANTVFAVCFSFPILCFTD